MSEFIYRTEEMNPEQIKDLFVNTPADEEIIRKLKSQTPILLVGSRGVGKSFLFRVAEARLNDHFETDKIHLSTHLRPLHNHLQILKCLLY